MATNANGALNLERVEQLLARPVLLPINSGEKAPWIPGWQNTSPALMMDPEYRQKLENSGNIGVLLRDGLVAIDFDDDDSAENFFEQNPSLRHGTRSSSANIGKWPFSLSSCWSLLICFRTFAAVGESRRFCPSKSALFGMPKVARKWQGRFLTAEVSTIETARKVALLKDLHRVGIELTTQ